MLSMGFSGGAFGDEFFGGKVNGIIPSVVGVEGTGEFENSEVMTKGDSKFFDKEIGIWCNDGGTE